MSNIKIIHYYRKTEPIHSLLPSIKEELKDLGFDDSVVAVQNVETESCFNVQVKGDNAALSADQTDKLEWLLGETFDKSGLALEKSFFVADTASNGSKSWIVEFGPRLAFTSAFSSNATSICQSCDLPIERLELSRRYKFVFASSSSENVDKAKAIIKAMLHDRMTEQEYGEPLQSFDSGMKPNPVRTIPIMEEGRSALEKINAEMGLGFDEFDLDYYTKLFKVRLLFDNVFFVFVDLVRWNPGVLLEFVQLKSNSFAPDLYVLRKN